MSDQINTMKNALKLGLPSFWIAVVAVLVMFVTMSDNAIAQPSGGDKALAMGVSRLYPIIGHGIIGQWQLPHSQFHFSNFPTLMLDKKVEKGGQQQNIVGAVLMAVAVFMFLMALLTAMGAFNSGTMQCKCCGTKISPNAVSCPKCGEPVNKEQQKT